MIGGKKGVDHNLGSQDGSHRQTVRRSAASISQKHNKSPGQAWGISNPAGLVRRTVL